MTDDRVHIDRTRGDVAQAPGYDPELLDQNEYYGSLYSHYGYTPSGEPDTSTPASIPEPGTGSQHWTPGPTVPYPSQVRDR